MLKKIKQFITRTYNEDDDNYCWINTLSDRLLSKEEIENLKEYFNKKKFNLMIIINGCVSARPQRTILQLPEFLKTNSGFHHMEESNSNSFILCSWQKDIDKYHEEKAKLLKQIKNECDEFYVFEKVAE